ncbi:MAG TPA: FHA domain-containing protein [Solirubrobacteraceae bacterium]|jgi:predicted  nucleic acid-binding Zn-ribbon protein|nr:FHA domain-containing protein [Solirubrobacteraceae bacterium]
MDPATSGHTTSASAFRCGDCGHVVTVVSQDTIGECPQCGGHNFARASLFGNGGRFGQRAAGPADAPAERVREARLAIHKPGDYLAFHDDDGQLRVTAITGETTRLGRSLSADVRFDDPTVSRRHALLVREAESVRILDDRSLNGVFVNGSRVESCMLSDGDEIAVGRYRLSFVVAVPAPEQTLLTPAS